MANNPKRHHYIPQCHIKRFSNENNQLWYFDKLKVSKGVELRSPASIFWRHHHNTLIGEKGEKNYTIELELSKVESQYSDVSAKISDAVGAGRLPILSERESAFIREYTQLQARRSPDHEAALSTIQRTPELIDTLVRTLHKYENIVIDAEDARLLIEFRTNKISAAEALPAFQKLYDATESELSQEEVEAFLTSNDAKNAIHSANVAARYTFLEEYDNPIVQMKRWYVLLPSNLSFILGSNPIAITPLERAKKGSPLSGLVFPLTSRVAMVFGPPSWPFELEYYSDRNEVRILNQLLARNSTSFASASKRLTASLAPNL